jgi:dTMP kinase
MARRSAGLFVTLEGGEGAGKSTQTTLLAERLAGLGVSVLTTREPGGTDTAERLRTILLDPDVKLDAVEQVLLFYAARHNHVERVIRPALSEGKVVICDRFSDSTVAYQGAAGGVAAEAVQQIDHTVLGGFGPDLTLLLDLPVENGTQRVVSRGEETDRFEQASVSFHQRLRDAFLEIAQREPERVKVIDALQPVETVAGQIHEAVLTRLPALTAPQ